MRKSLRKVRDSRAAGTLSNLVLEISDSIRRSQYLATRSVNRELLLLYYNTGRLLSERIKAADWGDRVIEEIAFGIQRNFPGIRGFSARNLRNMKLFYAAYSVTHIRQSATAKIDIRGLAESVADFLQRTQDGPIKQVQIRQSVTAKFDSMIRDDSASDGKDFLGVDPFMQVFLHLGFTHHILLLQKCGDARERVFYMQQAVCNQWSVSVLDYHIQSSLYKKRGKLAHNFDRSLPIDIKRHAMEAFKDEYLLNFVTVRESDSERILESEIVRNIRDFLMSLGREFAFLGNQYRLVVDEEEFFVDLLFYHRRLQSLIAIDLKAGVFKPEHAGKMNFYLESLDQHVKLSHEKPSVGIILCKEKKNTIVEYAFKRIARPMGVATYVYGSSLPPELRKFLPSPSALKRAAVTDRTTRERRDQ